MTKEKARMIERCRMEILLLNLKAEGKEDFRFIEIEDGVERVSIEDYNKLANADGRKLGVFGKQLSNGGFQITPDEIVEDLLVLGEGPLSIEDLC